MVRQLLHGHGRFHEGALGGTIDFLRRLASDGQSPDALYVGCSDSRVVPEVLTASSPGRLFVIRNVANLVPTVDHADASVGAALDYAVVHLKVPHIIVCGHYGCGGVQAVLDGIDHLPAPATSLREWLLGVVPAVERARTVGGGPGSESAAPKDDPPDAADPAARAAAQFRAAVEWNVLVQLSNLATFPLVAEAVASGRLELHGWVYDLYSLQLNVFDPEDGRFESASASLTRFRTRV